MNALDGWNAKWFGSSGQGVKQTLNSKKLNFLWEYDSTYDDRILFYRPSVSGNLGPSAGGAPPVFPSTTTVGPNSLAGGSTPTGTTVYILASFVNGACPTNPTLGVQPGEVGRSAVLRTVNAVEAAAAGSGGAYGRMDFAFPYPVKGYEVLAFVVSTGAAVAAAANYVVTFSADFRRASVAGVSGSALSVSDRVGLDVVF
jgi:hypothetical protein